MNRKIAIKRLSASDLTFFEYQFRNTAGAKQKAFNLDRAVFVDELYPSLPLAIGNDRVPINLSIFGPGLERLHNLQRKILKQQKNWRLNGELIFDPPESPGRYASLTRGDFAVFEFIGDLLPTAARIYLVAKNVAADADLHAAIETAYGRIFSYSLSMIAPVSENFGNLVRAVELPDLHPLTDMLDDDFLEDIVQGGLHGLQKLKKHRKARAITKEEFERSKINAEKVGRLGEEILNTHFECLRVQGKIDNFVWSSEINPISPFDFLLLKLGVPLRRLDAKSTAGVFENPIHLSIGELYEMTTGEDIPYDIYRLFEVKESSAKLRVAPDVRPLAMTIIQALRALPIGVASDGVSILPSTLQFEDEIEISVSKD